MATGVRNRRVPTLAGQVIGAEDHDVHNKGSLTTSVILDIDLAEGMEGSFYHGKLTAIVKDFQFLNRVPTFVLFWSSNNISSM